MDFRTSDGRGSSCQVTINPAVRNPAAMSTATSMPQPSHHAPYPISPSMYIAKNIFYEFLSTEIKDKACALFSRDRARGAGPRALSARIRWPPKPHKFWHLLNSSFRGRFADGQVPVLPSGIENLQERRRCSITNRTCLEVDISGENRSRWKSPCPY